MFTYFLYGFVNDTAQTIKIGLVGDIDSYNRHSHGYYMVEFSS